MGLRCSNNVCKRLVEISEGKTRSASGCVTRIGSCQGLQLSGAATGAWPHKRCSLREFKVALCNNTLSKLGGGGRGVSCGKFAAVSELMKALIIFTLINCKNCAFIGALVAGEAATLVLGPL